MKSVVEIVVISIFLFTPSCGHGRVNHLEKDADSVLETITDSLLFSLDENLMPVKLVYEQAKVIENCFFVISKVHPEHLSVYEKRGADTVLLAAYPACIAKNKGPKERRGDNKTPESKPGPPFRISNIQDASSWHHDFGDGRGSILAYGKWFLRLDTPGFTGIGIHGSTGNRESIKVGRGSEGCIRLYDEDIIHLKNNYARIGTPVIILRENEAPLPFERKEISRRNYETAEKSVPVPIYTPDPQGPSRRVTVIGHHHRLRTGPSKKYPLFQDEAGAPVCPEKGESLPCLAEEGDYFKVIFKGRELYINKLSVTF